MSRPAPGCRVPVRVPLWVVEALRRRAAASGRTLEQEAGVVVREALPRLAAEAVAERLAHDTNAAEPGALAPGSPRDLSLNAARSLSPGRVVDEAPGDGRLS